MSASYILFRIFFIQSNVQVVVDLRPMRLTTYLLYDPSETTYVATIALHLAASVYHSLQPNCWQENGDKKI